MDLENKEILDAIQELLTQQTAENRALWAQQKVEHEARWAQQKAETKELLAQQESRTKELLAQQESRTKELLAQQKAEILDETTRNMKFLLDTEVQTKFNLLAEGQQMILEKLVSPARVDALEADVTVLKTAVRQLNEDVEHLKRAQ